MTKQIFKAGLVAAMVALVSTLSPVQPARAAHIGCGAVITTNTVLDSDIGPCPSTGVRIGASNITLDLNGHRIFGGPAPGEGRGIYLFRVSNVTVMNGRVTNFDMGVAIEGGSGNTVTGIQALDNIGAGATIGGDGIAILSSQNNRILNNHAINNGTLSGIGIYSDIDDAHPRSTAGTSSGNLIQANIVATTSPAGSATSPQRTTTASGSSPTAAATSSSATR